MFVVMRLAFLLIREKIMGKMYDTIIKGLDEAIIDTNKGNLKPKRNTISMNAAHQEENNECNVAEPDDENATE